MNMQRLFIAVSCFAAAVVTAPMQAQAADHLDCMAQPYEAKDQKAIDTYIDNLSAKDSKGPSTSPLIDMFTQRAGTCADKYQWAPQAIVSAVFFQFGATIEQGLRSKSPLSPADMARLEKAIAAADQDRLWGVIERMMGVSLFGDVEAAPDTASKDSDEQYLGLVIISSGIPVNDTNSEFAGALLASQAIQRQAGKRFESE
jgi:hypothetical protein